MLYGLKQFALRAGFEARDTQWKPMFDSKIYNRFIP